MWYMILYDLVYRVIVTLQQDKKTEHSHKLFKCHIQIYWNDLNNVKKCELYSTIVIDLKPSVVFDSDFRTVEKCNGNN